MNQPSADEGWYAPPPPVRPYGAPTGSPVPPSSQPRYDARPRLAAWWQRLLARLIDGVIVGAIGVLIGLPIWIPYLRHAWDLAEQSARTGQAMTIDTRTSVLALAGGAIIDVAYFVYEWVQVGAWGRTIGKRALGIRIVDPRTGAKPSWGQAAGRSAIFTLAPLVPYIGALFDLINVLWQLWDRPWRQCLHDKAARTIVEAA